MAKYSEEFKLSIIKQMMPPNNKSVSVLSKKNGIAEQSLFKWKREAKAKGIVITNGEAQTPSLKMYYIFPLTLQNLTTTSWLYLFDL